MNILAPVSTIMTAPETLITVSPEDNMAHVRQLFQNHSFHHIPVVSFRKLVGLVSLSDFNTLKRSKFGAHATDEQWLLDTKVSDVMVKGLGKVEPTDRIDVAIEIFLMNHLHALPVVENDELVGMVTPFDIMRELAKANVTA